MFRSIKNFAADESGVTAIEYALIASLIAVFIRHSPDDGLTEAENCLHSDYFDKTEMSLRPRRGL
ncbi:MAG TPA: Flp family type IVb pilin [Roseiarcus sp.]|jgi:hypothetical protein|nr:Flp family type IVb pilin [Roseiarcus sp.]